MTEEPQVETEAEVKTFDESYVKELRAEAKTYRLNLREAEKAVEALNTKVKSFEDKDKSEADKNAEARVELERKIADMEREAEINVIKTRVVNVASQLNIVDIDAAYKLLDLSQIDDDPKSVKKALEGLLKEKPYLAKVSAPPTPGVGGPPVAGANPDPWLTMLKSGKK